jgi:preprotein translocase subunit Sec63
MTKDEILQFFADNHRFAGVNNEMVKKDVEKLKKMLEKLCNRHR